MSTNQLNDVTSSRDPTNKPFTAEKDDLKPYEDCEDDLKIKLINKRSEKLKRSTAILRDYVDLDEDCIEIKANKRGSCPKLIDTRMRFMTILVIIFLVSVLAFVLFALLAFFNPMYDMFGPGILFSRGAALAIILLTMFTVFLVTYDLTTCCRNKLKKRCSTLFDFQILFHRFSGFLITFYSVVHTIGHLTGSVRGLAEEEDVDEINKVLTHKEFSKHLTYAEILLTTIPGITGILLLIVI